MHAYHSLICLIYSPLLRQYSQSLASDSPLDSMIVVNLTLLDQLWEVSLLSGMDFPCFLVLLRQLYRVCNFMPSLLATWAELKLCSEDSLLNMAYFLSLLYLDMMGDLLLRCLST